MSYKIIKDLVSIIIPCYNCDKYINKLLDSILIQDYKNIEIFIINDGSDDNIEKTILSYILRFTEKNINVTYINQINSGQSAALNNAIKFISGEFLIWPDSDDWYSVPNAISKLVLNLKKLKKDYAIVRCLPKYIDENTSSVVREIQINPHYKNENIFKNVLLSENIFWPPINYIISMRCFDDVNINREIYVQKDAGQNWQILLPLSYKYKCYTLNESYTNILVRKNSHSRINTNSYEKRKRRCKVYWDTIINTLSLIPQMSIKEKDKWENVINIKYQFELFNLSIYYCDISEANEYYKCLINHKNYNIPKYVMVQFYILKIPIIGRIIIFCLNLIRNQLYKLLKKLIKIQTIVKL